MAPFDERLQEAMIHVVTPFAHFGHWYISGPVYFAPVALLALYVKWSSRRDSRREDQD